MNHATTRVVEAVANHFFLKPEQLLSADRHKSAALARHTVAYVLREHQLPKPSLPEIARELGYRDHTSVLHGVRRIIDLATRDDVVRGVIEVGRQALEAACEDQGRMTLLAKCQRRNELLRQIRQLDEEIGFESTVGAAE